jgi:site-specific DNA-methyltransferase (cytosine-N4-specific)
LRRVVSDPDFTLLLGDAREALRELPDESVDCAATSPPFYALRDYGTGAWIGGDETHEHDTVGARGGRGGSGTLDKRSADAMPSRVPARVCSCGAEYRDPQIGLEETPEEWAAALVDVFAECRRILKPQGTLWVECGDSYVSGQGGRQSAVGELPPSTRFDRKEAGEKREGLPSSFGERDVGPRFYPGRDTGLKPKDLLGQPWLLAFALRADGWWLRQAIIWHKPNAMPESATDRCTTNHSYVFLFSKQARYHFDAEAIAESAEWARWGDQTTPKYEGHDDKAGGWIKPKSREELVARGGRTTNGQRERSGEMRGFDNRMDRADGLKNPRSVWTIPTRGYPDAHFATWPEALCERILKAGCPEGGTVLDPFMGSGTTALVARKLGRKSIGIELNPEYAELAARRLAQQSLLAEEAVA